MTSQDPFLTLDMAQLLSVMAAVILLILKDGVSHVVILSDILPVCMGFSFFVVLKLAEALEPILFPI